MPKKDFVMIGTDILEWEPFRNLKSCCERNAYLTVNLSSPANYIGTFRHPLILFSREANIPVNDLLSVIELLEAAELIEYDKKEEYVRLSEWFYSSNMTISLNTVKGVARDFLKRGVPKIEMVSRSIAEFVVASLLGVKAYREDSEHGPKVTEELREFVFEAMLSFPKLEQCLYNEMLRKGSPVKVSYSEVFMGVTMGDAVDGRRVDSTWENPSPGGLGTPSKHKTKPYLTQTYSNLEPAVAGPSSTTKDKHEKVQSGPMQSTLNSELVRKSKKQG